MKKRNFGFRLTSLCLAALFTLSCFALYNDAKFDNYENMRDKGGIIKYTVPNLFRDDAPIKNVKRFPLVVQGSVEYVPLEVFFGLSDISVNTELGNGNFYIRNSKNENFVSFDIATDTVMTHLKKAFTMETKVFYTTRYVPARSVCDLLAITCEVYDDPTNGVYAVRITSGDAQISINDLIKMYSPTRIPEVHTEPLIPDNPTSIPDTDSPNKSEPSGIPSVTNPTVTPPLEPPVIVTPPVQAEQPSKGPVAVQPEIESAKTLYFIFCGPLGSETDKILSLLSAYNIKATFFCDGSSALSAPEIFRSISVKEHNIGIYIPDDAENLEESAEQTNTVFELLTKSKTRRILTDKFFEDKDYTLALLGLDEYGYNLSSGDSGSLSANTLFENLKKNISDIDKAQKTNKAYIRFSTGKKALEILKQLLPYIKTKTMYTYGQI